jgi:putative membrane protein
MKRSFFQKTFNLNLNLFFFGFIAFFLSYCFHVLSNQTKVSSFLNSQSVFVDIQSKLQVVEQYAQSLAYLLILIAIILIVIELCQRIMKDSVWNYFKSVYQTLRLRQFLRQEEHSEPVMTIENQTVTRFNPVLRSFNRVVSKCTVDVRKDSVSVFLKVPKTQQAQKLLREMEEHIKEEISSRNPKYYFSAPIREKSKLWFTGAKR